MRPRPILPLCIILPILLACSGDSPEAIRKTPSPGSLPKDSAGSFALLTSGEREQLRERLIKEGKYDCCTRPGCTECIGTRDSCGCYIAIKSKDPICGECLNAYKEGSGKLKMVSIVELEKIRNDAKIRD